ncbi:MAG: 16S rRNA (cytosine1402-N4)-methyltransferase [Flavobacteriaceae bacterium]|jgi:16S rRNA (cytosine1402-N4)-methyltransferase
MHIPVLLNEAIEGLDIQPHDVVVDMTLGGGGHARALLDKYPSITLLGIDKDPVSLKRAQENFNDTDNISFHNVRFDEISSVLEKENITSVDKILFDLGLNTWQLKADQKGFGFSENAPLYMTLGNPEDYSFTAQDIVNEWKEEDIANVIYGYGDEKFSRRIAKAIVEKRAEKPFETTFELAQCIFQAVPSWYRARKTHPATKSFQALRIAVNDEEDVLRDALRESFNSVPGGGRIAVISFHSGEDRIVKNYFRDLKQNKEALFITKKPIVPTIEETKSNPASRSAKLRIIQKI